MREEIKAMPQCPSITEAYGDDDGKASEWGPFELRNTLHRNANVVPSILGLYGEDRVGKVGHYVYLLSCAPGGNGVAEDGRGPTIVTLCIVQCMKCEQFL